VKKTEEVTEEKTEEKTEEVTVEKTEEKTEEVTVEKTEENTEENAEEGEDVEEEEGEDEEEVESEEQMKEEAESEEIGNLQRAWEMFELAKLVYTKHFNNDLTFKNKRIAECLLKLGEISIEQEIYEQAITDITESIRIQEEQKENRDERMLAESFYQLGLCQQFNNMFKEANETYQKSINIMQLRIEKLKGRLLIFLLFFTFIKLSFFFTLFIGKFETIKDDAEQEAERTMITDEIKELEALLPEMMSKLEEVNEQGEKSLSLIKEAKEMMMNTMATTDATKTACVGEVKDITNMVKSKRKIDATEDTTCVKKTRLSENGSETATENSEPTMEATEITPEEKAAEPENVAEPMVETAAPITV
jgi:nuclear autoantigenic sperm protein